MGKGNLDAFLLNGKVCLVTGAGRGIGVTCAEVLADAGAKVVVTDVMEAEGKVVVEGIKRAGGEAIFQRLDVTDEGQWEEVIKKTVEVFGGLDVIVNNAGIEGINLVENITLKQWNQVLAINAGGVFLGTKHGILAMKPGGIAGKGGSIINMCSMCGLIGIATAGAYTASKGAVRLLTKVAAVECCELKYGIRVNSVHPGMILTPLLEEGFKQQAAAGVAATAEEVAAQFVAPIGRLGSTKDVANAVLYLASEASAFTTGSELVLDGGYTAQ